MPTPVAVPPDLGVSGLETEDDAFDERRGVRIVFGWAHLTIQGANLRRGRAVDGRADEVPAAVVTDQ